MKTKISELRDKLYESLPTGDVDTFELIKLIKEHIKELDKLDKNFISKAQAKKELKDKFKDEVSYTWREIFEIIEKV